MDDKVDIILENIGSPSCKDYKRRDAHIVKCERNSVDALLHRFQRSGPMVSSFFFFFHLQIMFSE